MADGEADEPHERARTARGRAEAARRRADTVLRSAEAVRQRTLAAQERYKALAEREPDTPSQWMEIPPEGVTIPPRTKPAEAPSVASVAGLRLRGADMSEQMARAADMFADYLEEAARRGDRERRLGIAAVEREIAGIERRNAARLRRPDDHSPLEPLPDLPGAGPAGEEPEAAG